MAGDFGADFKLATIAQGQLEKDFLERYMDVLNSLKKGEKGSVTIKIELARPQDMDSLVRIDYAMSTSKPKRKVGSMAAITENKQQKLMLMTDRPDKVDYSNVTMLDQEREAN